MKKLLTIGVSIMLLLSLAACSKNESSKGDNSTPSADDNKPQVSLSEIISSNRADDINDAMPIITNSDDELAELVFTMLNLKPEDMSEYAISISPMNVNAYCVAIVKPAEGKEDAIKDAFSAYKSSQEAAFDQYLPEQYKIARDSVMAEAGDYIIFVMSEDSSDLRDTMVNVLK